MTGHKTFPDQAIEFLFCGVELDDGTWHWTTATVTDGDTLELGAGLAGDGAAINNDVI